MKLIIVHYHLRPGGIRRVLELATPSILRESGLNFTSVVVSTGEAASPQWRRVFEQAVAPVPVRFFVSPALGYFSEQTHKSLPALRRSVHKSLGKLFGKISHDDVVWIHNAGLARNPVLVDELTRICEQRGVRLIAHHHDWWFDNRWQRWTELRRAGFATLDSAARLVFGAPHARHAGINELDSKILKKYFGSRSAWLPNPVERQALPSAKEIHSAKLWLKARVGPHTPVWILPCRLLRRKNVAEALLLKNWLRPEAWLVTTGGVSSADEQSYFDRLNDAAYKHHWRLQLGILNGPEAGQLSVPALLAASEAVLLTSIQEGFGLPYLEAAAAGRPLIARNLPNIAPDLAEFGFRFPQAYDEIMVDPGLFDLEAEQKRQQRLFNGWVRDIAAPCRGWVKQPLLSAGRRSKPVPFSRLTLKAQLEVLQQPVDVSWQYCAPLNPFLATWRRRAAAGKLRVSKWPSEADHWLSGAVYAKRFAELLAAPANDRPAPKAMAVQNEFIRLKLSPEYLYPLLWSCNT